ncbi:adenylyltransferase and sulfurtransferase [Gracilibacillus ureilyticus]|uniref:Adenylyltransferase and sulfurtransferase n=1 Tax=Gracilibacillus ureilyticus TaxID=531814 RepID=A0A1H9S0A2_9BACI|nr:ThiF family adenylyltransferase [Gracilibacillus ureilyticus]SER78476.1 adenylyltransferase and sulfurtransferase [Gracilibacillus ureilyticus]
MSVMDRYHRQTLFQPIGPNGQDQLMKKHVLIVGCGALGSSIAEMLARAGIGKLTLIDRDYVDLTNLQRQHLFTEEDVADQTPKAIAVKEALKKINRHVKVDALVMDATANTLPQLVEKADLIMDATDNFDIRFILNDISHKYKTPWIFGACVGSSGMSFTIIPKHTPCLDCLLKITPMFGATCDSVGVIGPAVQMVVSHQVTEAMKILINAHDQLRSKLVLFDLWHNQFQMIDVSKAKDLSCKSCGENATYPSLQYENQAKTEVLCGRDTVQIRGKTYDFAMLAKKLQYFGTVTENPFLVSVETKDVRLVFFKDGRTFIHGTNSIKEAKKIYYQMVG